MTKRFNITRLLVTAIVAITALGFASQAEAITIGDANYLGSITPGTPDSPTAETTLINYLITVPLGTTDNDVDVDFSGDSSPYDFVRSNVSCGTCPDAVVAGGVKDETTPTTGNFGSGFTYLIAKYGAGGQGSVQVFHVWYVAGLTGDFTLPGTDPNSGGLSHHSLYNPGGQQVPEPVSLVLLGSGLALLGVFRRQFLGK